MKVSLFIPCITDVFFPNTALSMVRVLERLGVEVHYSNEQTCCGQPAFNTGYHSEARKLAERFLHVMDGSDYIVAPSGSCISMVKIFYGTTLTLGQAALRIANALRDRTYEFSSFISDVLRVDDVGATFPARVTVHDSCHALRELGVQRQVRTLLHYVKGLELVELPEADVCCGFGGTFSVKFSELSSAMADRKISAIDALGVDYVTAVDSSCLMHIQNRLVHSRSTVKTIHIADILAQTA